MTARRLAAQQLSGPPARSPEEVVRRLLAVQAQDPRGARLSIRSRTAGLTAADVDDALTARRSLLVTWLNRGTLHLVTADDYWWLHPLTTPQLVTGNTRRLRQEGVGEAQADRGVEVVTDAVTAEGPQTRGALRVRLDAAGVPTGGQALVHVLLAASLRGHVVRGPMCGGEQAYVAVRDWLGEPPPPVDRDEALGRLARRYLAGHGPAGPRDLATWAGIPLGEARRGIRHIAAELVDVSAELAGPAGQDADPAGHDADPAGHGAHPGELVDLADRAPAAGLPPPRLLGPFDPVLHGWASRGPIVGRHRQVVTSNGLFRATAFVGGRVVGTWGLAAGTLSLRLLEPVSAAALDALREDAADVLRFLGLPPRAVTVTSPG